MTPTVPCGSLDVLCFRQGVCKTEWSPAVSSGDPIIRNLQASAAKPKGRLKKSIKKCQFSLHWHFNVFTSLVRKLRIQKKIDKPRWRFSESICRSFSLASASCFLISANLSFSCCLSISASLSSSSFCWALIAILSEDLLGAISTNNFLRKALSWKLKNKLKKISTTPSRSNDHQSWWKLQFALDRNPSKSIT